MLNKVFSTLITQTQNKDKYYANYQKKRKRDNEQNINNNSNNNKELQKDSPIPAKKQHI